MTCRSIARKSHTQRALAGSEPHPAVEPFIPGPDARWAFLVASGVVGSYFLGRAGYKHFFVDGITDEERRGVLYMGVSCLALWAAQKFLAVDKKYYSIESLPSTAQEIYQEVVR